MAGRHPLVMRPRISARERQQLESVAKTGKSSAQQVNRARMLLLAAEGKPIRDIAAIFQVRPVTVKKTLVRFKKEHLKALKDHPRPGRPSAHTGRQEAKLVALACTPAPEGRSRWSLRLLAKEAERLEIFPAISHRGVRLILKKMNLSLGSTTRGVFPRLTPTSSRRWRTSSISTNGPTAASSR